MKPRIRDTLNNCSVEVAKAERYLDQDSKITHALSTDRLHVYPCSASGTTASDDRSNFKPGNSTKK